jgi:hypothetical protein
MYLRAFIGKPVPLVNEILNGESCIIWMVGDKIQSDSFFVELFEELADKGGAACEGEIGVIP